LPQLFQEKGTHVRDFFAKENGVSKLLSYFSQKSFLLFDSEIWGALLKYRQFPGFNVKKTK